MLSDSVGGGEGAPSVVGLSTDDINDEEEEFEEVVGVFFPAEATTVASAGALGSLSIHD